MGGVRRSAKGPVALAAAADVSQTGVFFFLLHPTSSLCTLLFSFYALREKLTTCGLEFDNVSCGGWILLIFFCFLFIMRRTKAKNSKGKEKEKKI